MHGRIVQYSHTTGVGIIINHHRKLFDFKLSKWQDKTRIPEIDLLVDFKLDEDTSNITFVVGSKYQNFTKDSIVKEKDFWNTNTDEELERLEQGVFEDLVAKTVKETDYMAMSDIKPSIAIDSFIMYHFSNENNIINYALKLPTCGYELLDYRIVTKFLMRTLDSLIYTEKRYTRDTFSAYLEIYSKLQYFVTPFYLSTQDTKKVYEELFLSQQLYFISAKRKLIDTKDELLRIDSRLRMTKSSISSNEQRLSGSQNKQQAEVRERLNKLKEQGKELAEARVNNLKLKEKLEKLIDEFSKRYESSFAQQFESVKERIFNQIKVALNTTITSLDNKMWQLGMQSDPIKNHYFRLNTNYSFCIMAFILQYIKTLDTSKLNDANRLLYSYVVQYRKRNTKSILIVSANDKINHKLRTELLALYKDFLITVIDKKMEYEITIANQTFDYVIIDNELEGANPIEMVLLGKGKKINKDTKFIIYQIPKII